MADPAGRSDRATLVEVLRPRVRLVGGGVLAGVAVALLGSAALAVAAAAGLATGSARAAAVTGFALGALALGVGVLGWSGSVMAGRGVEAMQAHLDTGTDWTEAKSRRAMARIAGFGVGVMLASSAVEALG